VNLFFTGLWIGAIASSFYTCGDLCSATEFDDGWIKYATLCCDCSTQSFSDICDAAIKPRNDIEQRSGRYEATQGLDILLA
jgi:hypothetical protein